MAFDTTAKILITGETQGLEAAMNKALGVITQRSRDIDGVLRSAISALNAFGAGLSIGALTAFTRSAIDAVAALDDMSETTGMSVENLSRWRQVARISGTEMASFESGVLKLSRALSGADDESKGAAEAFKAIGLSVAELKRLNPDQQFEAFAKAMNSFADGANKTTIGQQILVRYWRELAPLIKDYAEAGKIAADITAKQAAQAEKLQKEWNALALSAQNLAQSIVLKLASAFRTLRQEIGNKGLSGTIRDIIDPQSELSLQAKISELRRKQSGAKTDSEFAELESEIVSVQVRLADALRLKRALVSDTAQLPQAPQIRGNLAGSGDKGSGDKKVGLSEREKAIKEYQKTIGEVITKVGEDIEKMFAEQEENLERYSVSGSKEYMKMVKEQYEFENWAYGELANERIKAAEEIQRKEGQAAEEARREWERTSDSIASSLTDALMRGFEDGKDWAKNFIDTLKNWFATLVLRPIIQPIAQSVAGGVLGMLGMGQAGNASASGNAGSALSMALSGSSIFGGLGGGVGLTGLTQAFGAGMGLTATEASAAAAAYSAAGYTGVSGAISAGSAVGAGSAIGSAVGTALSTIATVAPYIALAFAAYSLFKKKRGGPKQGGFYATRGWSGERWYTPNASDAALQQALGGLSGQYSSLIGRYGATSIDPNFVMGFDTDPMGTAQNRVDSAVWTPTGNIQTIAKRQYGRGDEALQAAISEHMTRMLVAALRETDLDPEINAMLDALNPATAGLEQLTQALDAVSAEAEKAAEQMAAWTSIARSIAQMRLSLAGGDLSPLSGADKLRVSRSAFEEMSRRAALGDISAASGLGQSARDYLTAARGYYASGSQYASIYADVQSQLERAQNTALRQAQLSDLVSETRIGNQANEAGLSALLAQLKSIDDRLAAMQSANDLALAA